MWKRLKARFELQSQLSAAVIERAGESPALSLPWHHAKFVSWEAEDQGNPLRIVGNWEIGNSDPECCWTLSQSVRPSHALVTCALARIGLGAVSVKCEGGLLCLRRPHPKSAGPGKESLQSRR